MEGLLKPNESICPLNLYTCLFNRVFYGNYFKIPIIMNKFLVFFLSVITIYSCQTKKGTTIQSPDQVEVSTDVIVELDAPYIVNKFGDTISKLIKTDAEWKAELSQSEYHVLREKGTERSFTGDLLENKVEGLYTCRGCGLPLFNSKHKFESGTGWPSFYDVVDKNTIIQDTDYDLGYARTELTCGKCGGHLGHVFNDGPKPTGLRYCINAVSLDFVKTEYSK